MNYLLKRVLLVFGLAMITSSNLLASAETMPGDAMSQSEFDKGFAYLSRVYKDDAVASMFKNSQKEPDRFFKDLNSKRFATEHSPDWYVDYKKAITSAQAGDWKNAHLFLEKAGKPLSIYEAGHSIEPCLIDILFVRAAVNKLDGHSEQSLNDLKSVFLLHQAALKPRSLDSEIFKE